MFKKRGFFMRRIILGTSASLGFLFLVFLPLFIAHFSFVVFMALADSPETSVTDAILFCLQLLFIYLIIWYYAVGFNVVWESFKVKHRYRIWMLSIYFVTLLGKWFYLDYYVTSLFFDMIAPLFLLIISIGTIIIPALLGRWVFCKTKIVIAQKILAWTPIVLWGILSVFLTIASI
jgi:hypothetical protein